MKSIVYCNKACSKQFGCNVVIVLIILLRRFYGHNAAASSCQKKSILILIVRGTFLLEIQNSLLQIHVILWYLQICVWYTLTVEMTIIWRSCPWNSSTEPTLMDVNSKRANSRRIFSTYHPKKKVIPMRKSQSASIKKRKRKNSTCFRYGVMIPISHSSKRPG